MSMSVMAIRFFQLGGSCQAEGEAGVLAKGQHHEAAGLVHSVVSDEIYVPHGEG